MSHWPFLQTPFYKGFYHEILNCQYRLLKQGWEKQWLGCGGCGGSPHPRRIRNQDERKISDQAIHLVMNNSGTFQKNERRGLESEVQSRRTQLRPLSSPGGLLQFLQLLPRFQEPSQHPVINITFGRAGLSGCSVL